MASVNPLCEDQLLCPICLEVFTNPISTPCGHNFCKHCITKHWDNNDCSCPMCKQDFSTRPHLHVNTFISEICAQFKTLALQEENAKSSMQQVAGAGGVLCDMCTGHKLNAVKSCPVCLFSYCQSHLEPHLTVSRLQKHQLTEPMENLEDRICSKHEKPLELFCKIDQVCVCMVCTVLEHKSHDIVPLKEERKKQEIALKQTTSGTLHMMEERQQKIQEIRQLVALKQSSAQREMNKGLWFYTALLGTVQSGLEQFKDSLQAKQRLMVKRSDSLITELEREISALKQRGTKVEQLLCSEDHLHFLQTFKTLKTTPNMKDWTRVSFKVPSFEGAVEQAVAQLELALVEQKKQLSPEAELKRLQQWAVNVTLDPDTASPWLHLSEDLKQVSDRGVMKAVRYNPKRFSDFLCVLGKQGFSSGRFYYEVQVKGSVNWDLGVVKESINKKDKNFLSSENGSWAIIFRNGSKYTACDNPRVDLSLKSAPKRIGVFVDYEQGLVSFYDVETSAHLYSFTGCSFSEKLYPFFSPGNSVNGINSIPLIIKPVK